MVLRANAGRLLVYQIAAELSTAAIDLARAFRGPGAYERGDQLVRAAVSVASNIAEACGRGSVAQFRQFLLSLAAPRTSYAPTWNWRGAAIQSVARSVRLRIVRHS